MLVDRFYPRFCISITITYYLRTALLKKLPGMGGGGFNFFLFLFITVYIYLSSCTYIFWFCERTRSYSVMIQCCCLEAIIIVTIIVVINSAVDKFYAVMPGCAL